MQTLLIFRLTYRHTKFKPLKRFDPSSAHSGNVRQTKRPIYNNKTRETRRKYSKEGNFILGPIINFTRDIHFTGGCVILIAFHFPIFRHNQNNSSNLSKGCAMQEKRKAIEGHQYFIPQLSGLTRNAF